jgi:hypothetical protein
MRASGEEIGIRVDGSRVGEAGFDGCCGARTA